MNSSELLSGVERIWKDDQIAICVAAGLMAIQLLVLFRVYWRTRRPLRDATERIRTVAKVASDGGIASAAARAQNSYPRLARAWAAAFSSGSATSPDADSREPEDAFDPARLLPSDYNPRIDAAAPGLFTALGIVGTFCGLILGFLRVNPTEASGSVAPLLGGMVVAFFNSLLGVVLSVLWAYKSRDWRHDFDVSCDDLAASAAACSSRVGVAEQMVQRLHSIGKGQDRLAMQLGHVEAAILKLHDTTAESSKQLLDNLSTKVGDSFKSLVSMPFDRLNESVLQFDKVVQLTSDRQEEIKKRLDSAAVQLSEAEGRLTAAVSLAKECVEEFSLAALQVREGAEAAGSIVERTQGAAVAIGQAAEEVQRAASKYDDMSVALSSTIVGIRDASGALSTTSEDFKRSTGHLEEAVNTIKAASDTTVEQSVNAVRKELESAVHALADGIHASSIETITAYQKSSEQVVAAVDGRMSDLTDRLSAELTTLASRLPAEVESLNQAMVQIRTQIQRATRSMDDAVNQLAHRTPEALAAQLDAYDKALAKAMDHFSGTLQQWDGKLTAIESLSGELRQFSVLLVQSQTPAAVQPLAS